MTIAPITPLPDAPQRTDDPFNFIAKADAHVAALADWTDQVNALGAEVEVLAGDAETAASDSSASALTSASSANFAGEWGDLTGSLDVPASVLHENDTWQLLVDLADVTASEPGVTGDWSTINTAAKWTGPDTADSTLVPRTSRTVDVQAGLDITKTLPIVLALGDTFTVHCLDELNTGAVVIIERNGNTIRRGGANIDTIGDGNLTIARGETVLLIVTEVGAVEIV